MARTIYLNTGEVVVLVPDPDEAFIRLVEERLGRDAAAYLQGMVDQAADATADEYYEALLDARTVALRLECRLMSQEGLDDVAEIKRIINKII